LRDNGNAVLPGTLTASWHIATNGGFSSSPTLVDGTLYAGNNAGELFAIDPAAGKFKWTYKVSNPLMSAPIAYGALVIVGEGNENSPGNATPSQPIHVGDPPNALLALNRANGAAVWRITLPGTGMPTPAIVAGMLVHHNGFGSVIALDPRSGKKIYEHNLHSIASMSAALPVGAGAFVTSGVGTNAVWALRVKDGAVMWRALFSPVASGIGDCPAVADAARVYCDYAMPPTSAVPAQTERNSHFRAYALDVRTGKKLWDVRLEDGVLPKRNEAAIPLLAENLLFLGSSVAPTVHALDPASGQVKWRVNTHGPVKGGIVDVAGTLYFGDLGGYLWALNAANGQVLGVKKMRTPFNVGSPIVAGQTLIIGSRGGTLWAVPLATIRGAHDT
jgi:outer membrane protein assembly factor BamB